MSSRTVVVGGGLAGLVAALERAERGDEVRLLESRSRLGGLTSSFRRTGPAGSLWVDTGQHVFLRCCTAYRQFLDRLGVGSQVVLQDRLAIPVLRPAADGGRPSRALLRRSRLPAPAHLAPALAGYRHLRSADRLRLVRAALALRRLDPGDPASDGTSFGNWLRAHGQREDGIATLWDLIAVAALNAPADRAALSLAAMVFRTGLLDDASAADIGWSRIPLQELHGAAARRRLEAAGAGVSTGVRVTGLRQTGDRWTVLTRNGPEPPAEHVVLAVPPLVAAGLLPSSAIALPAGWARRLGSVPIVNVHVVYDRPVLAEPFVAAVRSPVQWVFDRTAPSGLAGGAQYLAVSLSSARDVIGQPTAALLASVLPALAALLPRARHAQVLDGFVTREPGATFDPAPGSASLRPGPATALPGLALAGAWTATGWPATMEGAVRSGLAAAAALERPPGPLPLQAPTPRAVEVAA